jgi:hypothetical protein
MSVKKTTSAADTAEVQEARETAVETPKPSPRVYCGPSVRGVARQFTVYADMLPESLLDFVKQHPAAGGLIVPVANFAAVRCRVEQPGTAENILFNKIKSEL